MDKEYLKQVKSYLLRIGHLNNSFSSYSRIYNMTTENIADFLKHYNLNNKKILTVAGSGDQRLNSYFLGASEVVCFDSNPLSLLQLKLKDAAIKNLSFNEFVDFFGISTGKIISDYDRFDEKLFNKLKLSLDDDVIDFFEYVRNNSFFFDITDIYFNLNDSLTHLSKINTYLTPDNYYILRDKIYNKEINFINCDITELPNLLNDKEFDIILLSNICDYISEMYEDNPLIRYAELIYELTKLLSPNGIIQVGYTYKHNQGDPDKIFTDSTKRQIYFPTNNFHSVMVNSFDVANEQDEVITYQLSR